MGWLKNATSGDEAATAPLASNHVDLLLKLLDFITGDTGTSFVISNPGSGYSEQDVIEVPGGTHPTNLSGATCTLEVISVDGGGGITGLAFRNTGSYTTGNGPSGAVAVNDLSGGGGTGATVTLTTAAVGWTVLRRTQEVDTFSVAVGGNGYSASETLSLLGGDTRSGVSVPQSNNPAQFNIDTVSSGAVATISVLDRGLYHLAPASPAATSGGSGSGATINVTFRDVTDTSKDLEVILQGPLGQVIGIRTFRSGAVASWELAGMAAYISGNSFDAQLTVSPGRYQSQTGQYLALKNSGFNWTMRVDDYGIQIVGNVDSGAYMPGYISNHDREGTSTVYPLPLLIIGSHNARLIDSGASQENFGGLNFAVAGNDSDDYGPGAMYLPGGGWGLVRNGSKTSTTVAPTSNLDAIRLIPGGRIPSGTSGPSAEENKLSGSSIDHNWDDYVLTATAEPARTRLPSPGTTERPTLQEISIRGLNPQSRYGVVRAVKQVDKSLTASDIQAETIITDPVSGTRWMIFNNCRWNLRSAFFALEMD